MKNSLLALILMFFTISLSVKSQIPAKKIAPFYMTLTNGKAYNFSQLSPGPVVLIYFSPDCDHCQEFTKAMLKNYTLVSNKQIIMITSQPVEMARQFASDLKIASYPNIKIGSEGTSFLVQKYYGVRSFPYIAIYDKTGKWVKTYEGDQSHVEIFKTLKQF